MYLTSIRPSLCRTIGLVFKELMHILSKVMVLVKGVSSTSSVAESEPVDFFKADSIYVTQHKKIED